MQRLRSFRFVTDRKTRFIDKAIEAERPHVQQAGTNRYIRSRSLSQQETIVEHPDWRRSFAGFIEDLFQLAGCAPPAFETAPGDAISWDIKVDGASFVLRHEAGELEDHVFVRCRFGMLPEGREAAALSRLMAFNLDLADSGKGAFGLDRDNNEVQFVFGRKLETTSPTSFLDECCALAVLVQMWQTGHHWIVEPACPIKESEFASLA